MGTTGKTRSSVLPEVPTISEAGVPGFEVTTWSGVVVPSGVPNPIVLRLNTEINKALVSQSVQERLGGSGYDLVGGTSEQFAALIKRETVKWGDVIKRTGAKPD
jgi:tripartite-type tricarboxylate transporter receptor subunit TctC